MRAHCSWPAPTSSTTRRGRRLVEPRCSVFGMRLLASGTRPRPGFADPARAGDHQRLRRSLSTPGQQLLEQRFVEVSGLEAGSLLSLGGCPPVLAEFLFAVKRMPLFQSRFGLALAVSRRQAGPAFCVAEEGLPSLCFQLCESLGHSHRTSKAIS